ncbi:hypothetical protein C8R44DRAFT_882493 [Mycena epipterygia]|nr:hypothetical protein C8R44DRAFT_882493 [Mycena epipterygia]
MHAAEEGGQGARASRPECGGGGGGEFYVSKGLVKRYPDAAAFAADTGIPLENVLASFTSHGTYASETFHNAQCAADEPLHGAIITPVVHYTMGRLNVDAQARVLRRLREVIGGVHGGNRFAGSSLLEAMVFGRIAGEAAAL